MAADSAMKPSRQRSLGHYHIVLLKHERSQCNERRALFTTADAQSSAVIITTVALWDGVDIVKQAVLRVTLFQRPLPLLVHVELVVVLGSDAGHARSTALKSRSRTAAFQQYKG
jgi:hypothetical protein